MSNDLVTVTMPVETTVFPDEVSLEFQYVSTNTYNEILQQKLIDIKEESVLYNICKKLKNEYENLNYVRLYGYDTISKNVKINKKQYMTLLYDMSHINLNNFFTSGSENLEEIKEYKKYVKKQKEIVTKTKSKLTMIRAKNFKTFVDKYNTEFLKEKIIDRKNIKTKIERFTNLINDSTCSVNHSEFKIKLKNLKKELNIQLKNHMVIKYDPSVRLYTIESIFVKHNLPYKKYFSLTTNNKHDTFKINKKLSAFIENCISIDKITNEKDKQTLINFIDVLRWIFCTVKDDDNSSYDEKMTKYVSHLWKTCSNINEYNKR